MANEFVARTGLIALSNSEVTGSLGLSGDLTVSGGDIVLGTTSIFSGGNTTSLNNIDAIDATTETTIEAAIDTLANLTSVQGQTVTLGGNLVTQNNNVTINAVGAARTLTLTESLTIGDGNDGTITFSGASKTLTVEDTSVVNQDLTTDASPQFTAVNVGAASDTTVARASAGDINVEGNLIYRAGGTDVPVADGGTGQSNLNNLITMGSHTTGNYVASLVAGTGVTLTNNSGETATPTIAIGQAVATTSTVTFSTGSFTGDVTILGNLLVQGATTQIQTSELKVEDALITVASGSANSTAANGAGIEIEMGGQTNPAMTWDHANQEFDFNYPISGSQFTGSFAGDGSGLSNIVSTLTTAGESGGGTVALKTQTLTVTGGEGIDTVASNQTITITGEDASTTNKGIVELATNAETNTGTDAARVVTPAALTAWTGDTAVVTVGTLAAGAISSGFGAIDIGTSALAAGSATVAGTNISGSSVSVATGGGETTSIIALVAVATYSSAQFDYTVNDGTNYRAGTVIAIWKAGASITFTDYSTPDIGNTSDATFTMDESGGNARLKFTSSAGTWSVKSAVRTL